MKFRSYSFAAMLALAFCSAATLVATPALAQTAGCAQIEVQNVRPEQGMLMVAAFADAASYNKEPVAALQMKAAGATMTFSLCGLNGSAVALRLYQDLNGNGKLDANLFGIPSEPWGASGKPPAMSAPTWDTTSVPLDGTTIVVKLSK